MAKKFGSSGSTRVGTGKIDLQDSNVGKWTSSVAAQVANAATVKDIRTKTMPIDHVHTDPNNPRKLDISQQQIIEIAKKHPISKALLSVEDPSDWIETYIQAVAENESLQGKALGDFASLVEFAAALKSADRLLHPIVVRQEESVLHLIAGERRLLAHILLGEKTIAARILDDNVDQHEISTLQWEENVQRVDMTLCERLEHIRKLVDAGEGLKKTSVTKLTKLLGRSRAECQRYLVVLRYPTSVLINAIQNGKVADLKTAAALAQLSPEELSQKLSGHAIKTQDKPSIKFNDKSKAHSFGELLKAAATQLDLNNVITDLNLAKPKEINLAINRLIDALEDATRG